MWDGPSFVRQINWWFRFIFEEKEHLVKMQGDGPKHQKEVFNERFQEISTRG